MHSTHDFTSGRYTILEVASYDSNLSLLSARSRMLTLCALFIGRAVKRFAQGLRCVTCRLRRGRSPTHSLMIWQDAVCFRRGSARHQHDCVALPATMHAGKLLNAQSISRCLSVSCRCSNAYISESMFGKPAFGVVVGGSAFMTSHPWLAHAASWQKSDNRVN